MVIKIKRGTTAQVSDAVLQEREFAFDKENNDLYVGVDGTTEKLKVSENSVYTASEYADRFLPKLAYATEGYDDVCPLDASGYIPTNKLPPQLGNEVINVGYAESLPTTGIENVLYVRKSDDTLWRYKNGEPVQLLRWPTFIFDGGTL